MNPQQRFRQVWLRYVIAVVVVAIAALLRVWPLQALGASLVWLTFYPAVMIVAIYGGLSAGLLATALACLIAYFLGPWLVGQAFIKNSADGIGMGVFVATGAMISGLAEAMRRANKRARKAQQQAEAANRAKSVFLATMSHELRTPLNAILGFSDLMRGDPAATAEQRENLDIINRSGEHLLKLIDDVLDMAKIEAGQVVLNVKPFDIEVLVRDVVDMLRVRAEEKGLQLRLEQSAAFPNFIKGDEEKLRQVIVNLVSNAIKFTRQGEVILRLDFLRSDGTSRLIFAVADSGVGISAADRARIFEPFVQVGKPATQKGTGLGLAIVREFVELMGGSLSVESEPERGSLFRVELPVEPATQAEVMPPAAAKGRIVGLAPGQPEYRVLIVEDQLENQILLRRLLEDAGFTVQLAENGATGVEVFRSFRPHFIWMDRRMPVMDGLEATRRIRALDGGTEVKIVAVSASVFGEQRAETLAQGMDDFVRKPYLPAEIFECMERHLGVRYTYDAPESAAENTPLSSAALARLSKAQRKELADALVNGDTAHIDDVVQRVAQQDAALAKELTKHLDHFDYAPVLRALEATQPQD
ncbi:MAG: response regulator [Rhodocyclales bacterium]|nr:response regulator [Rhodocyclales bacterium]